MCGLFFLGDETIFDVVRLTGMRVPGVRTGDIHPTEHSCIITGKGGGLKAEVMRWGFTGYDGGQLMINARAESALEKKSFSDSVLKRRCIIPAKHFYEWDAQKNKAVFTWEDSPSLYMAGFYNYCEAEERFVILTTEANESMRKTHDRMPLILPEQQIEDWIFEDSLVRELLGQESPMLTKHQDYEQLTLW